jgi:UPF0755 protein
VKRGVLWTLVSFFLLLSVSGLVYWDYNTYIGNPVIPDSQQQVKVVISQGYTLTQVVAALEEAGIVASPTYFRLYLLLNDLAEKMRAGVYYFDHTLTPAEVADTLATGPRTPYRIVTVIEGFNIWQVAKALDDAEIMDSHQFLELANDPAFAKECGVSIVEQARPLFLLEGYLFPETYYVAPGQTGRAVVKRMVRQTFKELQNAKRKNVAEFSKLLEEFGFTDHELVTMASIIEKETGLPHEKKLIASVCLNRLRKGMPLQTDPTLTYTMERKGAKPTSKDRKNKDNLYSTYAFEGLPPGPISNPGRDAILGVVAPASSRFLYFVAKRDGSGGHHFSTNLSAHNRAVKKYLKKK